MSRSLTLPVPSPREVLVAIAGVAVALAVVFVGVRLGGTMLSPSSIMRLAAEGDLHEVQLLGGAVYLGTIVEDDGDALRLARPAVVRQEQAPAASDGSGGQRTVVQRLSTDPFGIAADVLIPLDQVTLVGVVEPSSSLARAYDQATGVTPTPAASPSP